MSAALKSSIIFLTICTSTKKPILANPTAHTALVEAWRETHHWIVGRYILLPDHLHLFCSPAEWDALSLRRWVTYWKSLASKKWLIPEDKPLWQQDCWDRQLRNGESYTAKWNYACNNPVRHGLVKNAADWPYQGELNILEWHD